MNAQSSTIHTTEVFPKRSEPFCLEKHSLRTPDRRKFVLHLDEELQELIDKSSRHFHDADFCRILVAQREFDGPVTVQENRWDPGKEVLHYNLRQTLRELEDYMKAAEQAGLSYRHAVNVINNIFYYTQSITVHESIAKPLLLATRLYHRARKERFSPGEYEKQFIGMIKVAGRAGLLDHALYSCTNALRLGLTLPQAIKLVSRIPEDHGSIAGYWMGSFNDALKSFLPGRPDPELLIEVFDTICSQGSRLHQPLFQALEHLVIFGGPSNHLSSNEALSILLRKRIRSDDQLQISFESVQDAIDEHRAKPSHVDEYFLQNDEEPLELAALPYKKRSSLIDGLSSLLEIATAKLPLGEEVGEGYWVFDPKEEIWYSLGGKLETGNGYVRNKFVRYDISELSNTPYLFHIHPEDYEYSIMPDEDTLTIPQMKYDLVKFLTATPSRADYRLIAGHMTDSAKQVPTRSFIVHALGITEFTYPDNFNRLDFMAKESRNIRDKVMLDFDLKQYIARYGSPVNRLHFVRKLIECLNDELPDDFGIKLYPKGKFKG